MWNENARLGLCSGGCGNDYRTVTATVEVGYGGRLEKVSDAAEAAIIAHIRTDEENYGGAEIFLEASYNGPGCGGGDCGGGCVEDVEVTAIEAWGDGKVTFGLADMTPEGRAAITALVDAVEPFDDI